MVKTTVLLRDDIYALIISQFGKRELSSTINKMLSERLFKGKDECFGIFADNPIKFEREDDDRP